jgi:hypothetical protein
MVQSKCHAKSAVRKTLDNSFVFRNKVASLMEVSTVKLEAVATLSQGGGFQPALAKTRSLQKMLVG